MKRERRTGRERERRARRERKVEWKLKEVASGEEEKEGEKGQGVREATKNRRGGGEKGSLEGECASEGE